MNCLFCQSKNIKKAIFPRPTTFNNKLFQYMQCRDCDLIFIDPLPGAEDYDKMYSPDYHTQFYFKEEPSQEYMLLFNLLEKNIVEKTLVDYGCGDGSLVNFFSEKGYRCIGVEYDSRLVNTLREKYPKISFLTTNDFWKQERQQYGAIYMGDVLEHLGDPYQFVDSLHSTLRDDGLLMVRGPLENNFSIALLYRKFVSWFKFGKPASHVPYHISFANASNQRRFFESKGFKTLHYQVSETSWPFPQRFSPRPLDGIKWFIAKVSILFSKAVPGKIGNRFVYLGTVLNNSHK